MGGAPGLPYLRPLFGNVARRRRRFLRPEIPRVEFSQCELSSRSLGGSEIRHAGEATTRESDAIHAGVIRVGLDCNKGIRAVPVIEAQPLAIAGMTPFQPVTADNGFWFLRGRDD